MLQYPCRNEQLDVIENNTGRYKKYDVFKQRELENVLEILEVSAQNQLPLVKYEFSMLVLPSNKRNYECDCNIKLIKLPSIMLRNYFLYEFIGRGTVI